MEAQAFLRQLAKANRTSPKTSACQGSMAPSVDDHHGV